MNKHAFFALFIGMSFFGSACPMHVDYAAMATMLAAAELSGDPKKIAYVEHMIHAHNNHQAQKDAPVQKPMIVKQSEIKARAKL